MTLINWHPVLRSLTSITKTNFQASISNQHKFQISPLFWLQIIPLRIKLPFARSIKQQTFKIKRTLPFQSIPVLISQEHRFWLQKVNINQMCSKSKYDSHLKSKSQFQSLLFHSRIQTSIDTHISKIIITIVDWFQYLTSILANTNFDFNLTLIRRTLDNKTIIRFGTLTDHRIDSMFDTKQFKTKIVDSTHLISLKDSLISKSISMPKLISILTYQKFVWLSTINLWYKWTTKIN